MATLPNPLPLLATDPTGRSLGLERPLPPGRLTDATDAGPWHEPLLWYADVPAAPGTWAAVRPALRTAGLLPVLLDVGDGQGGPEGWELMPGEMSYPGDHDPEEVLAELWTTVAPDTDAGRGEAGRGEAGAGDWPGLAGTAGPAAEGPDPDALAAEVADSLVAGRARLGEPRLALVPARRSADVPAAIGWGGPLNHENDVARLCAVLRSWEDRFGVRVVALGFAHLVVSVAAPPATEAAARHLAAEHLAFCPDTIRQGPYEMSRDTYAKTLIGADRWTFWWD
ncbi:DUF4253 domain-containing protein [Streptomyces heilongjiangensis]|uniref:DUF4253 domain-containing protein n=1 Tax=Streptomyces heilongjiangensis TaxID=945052 RepID=A0ABW1BCB1_9ACTN|nr:DUF4253 domain-containing protein [Streptomyces heilongjiangensis]MDC2951466.1 DUF4253 domain-containing protein [Streptomyces heilongjiangensis]